MSEFGEWLADNGYLAGVEFPDGTIIAEQMTVMGAGQIVRGDRGGVAERWSYLSIGGASAAWLRWQAVGWQGEPEGWVRHQPSDRRRRNGDPATEYVAP